MTADSPGPAHRLAESLGSVGIWSFLFDRLTAERARQVLTLIEDVGFRALWIPEGLGSKEIFSHSGLLLSHSHNLVVAPGIANIWARDPIAMAAGANTLADAYPGRFVLGIGVSHAPSVNRRGSIYEKPLAHMRSYLDAMESAPYAGPVPADPAPLVLAALRPRMLELAAERTTGAHPYFVPVEHTARAREILGPGSFLAPEQAVVFETNPDRARSIARKHTTRYLTLDNYRNNLLWMGYDLDDLEGGGSNRLVDAIVAWGASDTIRERIEAHLDAGADHVSVQILPRAKEDFPVDDLRELARVIGLTS